MKFVIGFRHFLTTFTDG